MQEGRKCGPAILVLEHIIKTIGFRQFNEWFGRHPPSGLVSRAQCRKGLIAVEGTTLS